MQKYKDTLRRARKLSSHMPGGLDNFSELSVRSSVHLLKFMIPGRVGDFKKLKRFGSVAIGSEIQSQKQFESLAFLMKSVS